MELPRRHGPRPEVTHPTRDNPHPHQQLSQNAPIELQEALFERARSLEGVSAAPSCVSVPGARGFHLDPALALGPPEAFQCRTEFAHLHPAHDGSLHATLPAEVYDDALEKGWGDPHPLSGTMMLFGPRNEQELEVVWQLVQASYRFGRGQR